MRYTPPRIRRAEKTITCDVNNGTASEVVFTVTGAVLVLRIWGEIVEADDITNHTAGHLRTNDQTATIDLTEAGTGTALSGEAVGTIISKTALAAVAITKDSNAVGAITEPASAGQELFSPFIVVKKSGAVTTIDYRYTSTDTPHDCDIRWKAEYIPLSDDGALA